jgi:hypothetical protein
MNVPERVPLAGRILALCALIKGVFEYPRQSAQKRAEHLIRLR